MNIDVKLITISEDKARLILMMHRARWGSKTGWIGPLGWLVTALLARSTADFHRALQLNSDQWKMAVYLLAFVSLALFIYAVWRACRSTSVDDIIRDFKIGALADGAASGEGHSLA